MNASFVPVLLAAAIGCAPSVEAAEIIWTNTAGGSWDATINWSPNQIPTSADVAAITNSGTYTVTLNANTSVAGLRLGGSAGGQTLLISGPTLTVNGLVDISNNGFLSLLSGTVGGTGDILVAGLVNVFGGSFTGSGVLSIGTNGQVQINGNVNLGGRAIENAGHLVWTVGDITNGRALTNRSSGSFQILVGGNNFFSCSQTSVNAGLLRSSGSGTAYLNFPFSNSGAVQVQSGTVQLTREGNHTGSFVISGGATLLLGNGGLATAIFDFASSSTVTGEGNVGFGQTGVSGRAVNVNGIFRVTGTTTVGSHTVNFGNGCVLSNSPLNVLGGVANFNTGRMLSPSTFVLNGGTFAGTDSMTVTGAVTLTSGTTAGTLSGTGVITSRGSMTLGAISILSGTLENQGYAIYPANMNYMFIASNAVFNNLPGAVFDYRGASIGALNTSGTNTFNNAGVLRTSGPGFSQVIFVPFNNSGTVEVHSGSFFIGGGGTHSGSFQVDAGAKLEFGYAQLQSPHFFTAGSRVTGAGNLAFSESANALGMIAVGGNVSITGGANVFSGSYSNGGTLSISGGSASFNTTQPITVAQLNVSGGTLSGSDPIIVTGPMTWTGGTLGRSGPVNAYGNLTIGGTTLVLNGGALNNFGAANWSSGSIFTGSASVISNAPTATFDITFDGQTFAGFGGTRTLFNAGLLRKTGGIGTAIVSESVYNTGTIEARSGTLAFGNTFVQAAGTTLLAGGNIAASGPLQIQGGSLAGNGTVAANVVNSGRCIPGSSPGLLKINGDYTQTSSGHLEVELGGPTPGSSFDQLQVSGNASLRGALNVTAINGFHPTLGQTFRILTFVARTGDFFSFNDSTMAGLNRVYDATGLNLTASNGSPALFIAREGQQVVVSWPSNTSGYVLQSTTNLLSTNWTDVVSDTNTFIVYPVRQKDFFRLIKP